MKKFIAVLIIMTALFSVGFAFAGSADLMWTWDAKWDDGTVATPADLSGFNVYWGTSAGNRPNKMSVPAAARTATIPNLINGTSVYAVVTAVSTTASKGGGLESGPSNEVSALIPYKKIGGCATLSIVGNP